ncbi:MAG TPA: 4Fe-4S dicluster domain-containing protein [candidate division Zixibacteria bacterium]|nr:4Fe-4S dicluster domain-containing protein [candidate division Zixibacteria bacterium]
MASSWGVFLCDCRRTIALDRDRLDFAVAPAVLCRGSDPAADVAGFAAGVRREQPERILIGCCADQRLFQDALGEAGTPPSNLHFVNLKEASFAVHPDPGEAHDKASRLLRAAMEAAEAGGDPPSYNRLTVGGRVLIAVDSPAGLGACEKIAAVAERTWIVAPPTLQADPFSSTLFVAGRVTAVKGRLGDFRVTVESDGAPPPARREITVDQVVFLLESGPPCTPRTGLHLLGPPARADLEAAAERIRDLTGDFLKPVHVAYDPAVCAGGAAGRQACGVCIPACPYEAIARSAEEPLRVRVDHMACEGCGACASACPTGALRFMEPSPRQLYARLAALLRPESGPEEEPRAVLFHCGEQGRRALEAAGARPLAYPAALLPIEVPCLRHVSEAEMLAAFARGAAGVGLLGCRTCQHGERALLMEKIDFSRTVLEAFELGADRIALITAGQQAPEEAIADLARFASGLKPTPIPPGARATADRGGRGAVAEAIGIFIEQLSREPGRRSLGAAHSYGYAEVRESGCTLCRSCVNVCPVNAFRFDEAAQALEFRHVSCVGCGLCEAVCPENVIEIRREIRLERSALDHRALVSDGMVACTQCGKPYVNRKALEKIEARLFAAESLLDTFVGARKNLLRMCPDCRAVAAMLEVEKGWKP